MSVIGTIYEDVTTDVIGKIGSWQWLVTFISTVLTAPALFHQYEDIFMLHPVSVVCAPPVGVAALNSTLCYITIETNGTYNDAKCTKWYIKLMWLIWLKKSWLVFCEHRLKLLSTAIVCRFGLIFGCVIFGFISDSFGRKPAAIVGLCTSLGLELILTFCDSEGWFRLFVFLKSLFGSAHLFIGLILICEISSNEWRSTLSIIVVTPRLLAMVSAVPLANSAPNMETNSCMACLVCFLCIVLLRWCPESPQWLLFNRKIQKAEITLKNAAKMNGIRLCGEFKIRPVNHRAYNSLDETTSCVGVLTTPNTRTVLIVTSSIWAVYYFLWGSLYVRVYSEERSGDLLLKVFCFVGVLSCLTIIVSTRLALRYMLIIQVILTGATTIGVVYVSKGILRTLASSIAMSAGVVVHALMLNITPRLFAINIRASILGCCHASGYIGSTLSYILFLIQPMSQVTFLVVVMGATLTLVGLCLLVPNVDGRELPDITADMDYYSELSKPLRWATQKTNSPSAEEIEMRVYSFGSGRALSTRSHSDTRVPAQRIGFANLRRPIAEYLRGKFARRK